MFILKNVFSNYIWKENNYYEIILTIYRGSIKKYKRHNKIKWKHEKKFKLLKNLSQDRISAVINKNQEDNDTNVYVENYSNKKFSEQQLKVLEKGLKYVLTPESIDLVKIITNAETSLSSTTKIVKQAAISEITEFIQKYKAPKLRNLTKIKEKVLKELRSIKDIAIVPADKGGRIAILNKNDYIFKMEDKITRY